MAGVVEPARPPHDGEVISDFRALSRVASILPDDQEVVTVDIDAPVREAIALMEAGGFSQLPVRAGLEIVGVFSYRSLARRLVHGDIAMRRDAPDVSVEHFIDRIPFMQLSDELEMIFDRLEDDDVILIGRPDALNGIATAFDFVQYLYRVASPFVLVQEIELGLRELVRSSVTDSELAECARTALTREYDDVGDVPVTLAEMSFAQQVAVVTYGDNWPRFTTALGAQRAMVRSRLDGVRELRNDLFHFRRHATAEDHETLVEARDWVHRRIRTIGARR